MSRFFLLGTSHLNAGPNNVNKSLILNSDGDMDYIHGDNKILRKATRYKFLLYNKIVVSGHITDAELAICQLLRKKIIYLMHGCRWYESMMNNLNTPQKSLDNEKRTLQYAHKIVCVSKRYSEWVKKQYPEHNSKIVFVNNGITIQRRVAVQKIPYTIAVSGGNRTIKNNHIVCQAVEKLIREGIDCKVYVFGRNYPQNPDLSQYPFVTIMGQLDKEEYYNELDKISLFVVNSEMESFGLVIGDAINCNCSLLMSEIVGATSIMKTTESDIIFNNHNIEEISYKIVNLLEHSNAQRLFSTIDIEDVSEKRAYDKLKEIVNEK